MDSGLVAALEALGLGSSMQQKLVDLGIKSKTDIGYIKHDDLKQVGFNLVEQRKVMSLCDTAMGRQVTQSEEGDRDFGRELSCMATSSPSTTAKFPHAELSLLDDEECQPASDDEEPKGPVLGQNDEKCESDEQPSLSKNMSSARRKASMFWQLQEQGRPMRLIFIRHGESEANVNRQLTQVVPDHALHLTAEGCKQALDAGDRLRSIIKNESVKFIVSPYVRTRETLNGILHAWDQSERVRGWAREDVRIREQEYGNYDSPEIKKFHSLKKDFGPFYYRFPEGESIADCYDRASLFVESLYRTWTDNRAKNFVIVGHGMMILVTLSRLLRMPVDEFLDLAPLTNCEFIVLERPEDDAKFNISYTWCRGKPKDPTGIRQNANASPKMAIWSGNPEDPPLTSQGEASECSS